MAQTMDEALGSFATRIEEAETLKVLGNDQFGKGAYAVAINHYNDALHRLPLRASKECQDEDQDASTTEAETKVDHAQATVIQSLRIKLQSNLAASYLKLEHYDECVRAASEVLAEEPTNVKALHRRATAHEALGGWSHLSSAKKDLEELQRLEQQGLVPASYRSELQASLSRIQPKLEQAGEKEKEEMLGKLKNVGNQFLGLFGLSTDNFQLQQQDGGGYSINFKQ